jgi:hypothetical protein
VRPQHANSFEKQMKQKNEEYGVKKVENVIFLKNVETRKEKNAFSSITVER